MGAAPAPKRWPSDRANRRYAKLPISHFQASEQFKIATEDGQHKSVRENPLLSLPISRLPNVWRSTELKTEVRLQDADGRVLLVEPINATVHSYQEDLKVDWRLVQENREKDENGRSREERFFLAFIKPTKGISAAPSLLPFCRGSG